MAPLNSQTFVLGPGTVQTRTRNWKRLSPAKASSDLKWICLLVDISPPQNPVDV